jgi:hypothetical protein
MKTNQNADPEGATEIMGCPVMGHDTSNGADEMARMMQAAGDEEMKNGNSKGGSCPMTQEISNLQSAPGQHGAGGKGACPFISSSKASTSF